MAEFSNTFVQQIAANANAVFTETPVEPKSCIVHREGSGVITLRGMTNQCFARYLVVFGGNIARGNLHCAVRRRRSAWRVYRYRYPGRR